MAVATVMPGGTSTVFPLTRTSIASAIYFRRG
jgi:hypothetical protein